MRPTIESTGQLLPVLPALAGLLLLFIWRVRRRLRMANPQCLERLRSQGLLNGDAGEECRRLTGLLAGIAPAVWLRERISIRIYTCAIRSLSVSLPGVRSLRRELYLLAAYHAHRYQDASQVLQHLRDESRWEPVPPCAWPGLSRSVTDLQMDPPKDSGRSGASSPVSAPGR